MTIPPPNVWLHNLLIPKSMDHRSSTNIDWARVAFNENCHWRAEIRCQIDRPNTRLVLLQPPDLNIKFDMACGVFKMACTNFIYEHL